MKSTLISLLVFATLIGGGAVLLAHSNSSSPPKEATPPGENVSMANGNQIVDIRAKGGYQPRRSVAKAGVPTTLRFETSGTFDCSSSVRIPSMDISTYLPQTGTTDIAVGIQPVGIFKGSCGMGMYSFEVDFQG